MLGECGWIRCCLVCVLWTGTGTGNEDLSLNLPKSFIAVIAISLVAKRMHLNLCSSYRQLAAQRECRPLASLACFGTPVCQEQHPVCMMKTGSCYFALPCSDLVSCVSLSISRSLCLEMGSAQVEDGRCGAVDGLAKFERYPIRL
jgi:hypothetical protein